MKSNMILCGKKNNLLHVRIIRIVFAVVCFACITLKANAQAPDGCYIASANSIYTNGTLTATIFGTAYVGGIQHSTVCGAGSTTSTQVYIPSGANGANCIVLLSGSTFLGGGVMRNYTMTTCPLDDYLPLLFVPIALVAVWRIKKQNHTLVNG